MSKERKVIVKKVDEYELHLEGDSTHYTAKTEKEAKKQEERMRKEEKERVKEENNEEKITKEKNEKIVHNLSNYIEKLGKDYWHICRNGTKEEKEELKGEIEILKGILNGTIKVKWHQGILGDSNSYSIEQIKEEK